MKKTLVSWGFAISDLDCICNQLTAFSVSRECFIKLCEFSNLCNLVFDKLLANITTISTARHLRLKNRNIIIE